MSAYLAVAVAAAAATARTAFALVGPGALAELHAAPGGHALSEAQR